MEHKINQRKPNLEKLAAYINKQPNPREFAAVLLAVAALKPQPDRVPNRNKEMEVCI